ncbi:MAG TPA: immunoglobulin domain-containing protein [Candidatus Pullichristensenella excrementipullorum]|nr:immunoglobulin domain-containing protein [Candidatus Pullichristensenella excrementipullorum]
MKRRTFRVLALVALLLMLGSAVAEGVISTTVVMRVSHLTQDAVVDAGEDLSMEVNIDGVSPASYQWYFEGAPISGADQRVYNIVNAAVEDSGIYRMDAFDENGDMLLSMEIAARVIDDTVPKSGDSSLPVGAAFAVLAAASVALFVKLRRAA